MSSVPISGTPYYLSFAAGGRSNACYSPPSPPPPSAAVAASLDLPILEEPPSTTTPLILSSSAASSSSALAFSPPSSPTPVASLPIAIPVVFKASNDGLNGSKLDAESEKGGAVAGSKPQHGSSLSYDLGTVEKEKDSHIIESLASTPSPIPSSSSSSSSVLSTSSSASSASAAASAASSFPSHVSVGQYGQDAWFVHSRAGSSLHAFGVADGVGGWRSQGVDSGIIARTMMRKCCEQVDGSRELVVAHSAAASASSPATLPFSLPSLLLSRAYQAIKVEGKVTAGSTTACVLTVTPCRCLSQHSHSQHEKERRRRSTSSSREDGLDNEMLLSPPPSPSPKEEEERGAVAAREDGRHELSAEDEAKEGGEAKETQPAVQGVDLPLGGSMSDSDDSVDEPRPDDVSFTSHIAGTAVPASSSPAPSVASTATSPSTSASSSPASQSYKTASAFWSAVEHVIHSSPLSSSRTPAGAASLSAPSPPSPLSASVTSPPPSRPPSPSSPPLFLSCASLGDSGFLLLRHQRVIHRSDIQRSGRIVKQLAVIPPHLRAPIHRYCDDPPSDATLSSHRLEDGDLIIVGSDGLLDNLCSSWTAGSGSGFFVPWGRFLLGGMADRDDEGGDREVIDKQNRKVEGIVKESCIDWEGRQDAQAAAAAGTGKETLAASSSSSREELVRLICDRLVQEATDFMHSMEGKPDDLTVLVLMVGKIK